MSRKSARKAWLSTVGLGVGIWGSGAGRAADPLPLAPEKPSDIRLIKQDEKKDPNPKKDPAPVAAPLPPELPPDLEVRGGGTQGGAPAPQNSGTALGTRTEAASAGGTTSDIAVAANQAPQVLNASDLSQLLFKSSASTGVQFQQRNPLVNDPRIRGLRNTQFLLYGDSAFFAPVRLDLDTPVTRFDPGSVRDIILVKGPYSVLYGPGHAVLDVATLDSPRFQCFEFHGRTALGYQTNGQRWDGLQSVWAGESNWGARVTYNGLTGSDYKDGAGNTIPSSYLSHNVNWAIGWDLTEKTSVEFKGQRVYQQGLEFPGLYFDVQELNTEAYTLRFTSKDQGAFDRFEFDAWYNTSVGVGNTTAGPKQNFVQQLLAVSFNPGKFNQSAYTNFGYLPLPGIAQAQAASATPLNLFTDQSTTNFATSSLGYRTFLEWGKEKDENKLIVGTDLRLLGQGLQENIRLTQVQGTPINPLLPAGVPLTQNQSIPDSNSVNPGLFAQLEMPVNNRLTLRGGGRTDWVRTSTNERQITGNIDLFGPPGQPNQGRFSVDPIVYSTQYGTNPQTDSTRNFFLLAGFFQSEYKFTDEVSAVASVGHSQRAPTLTELYAAGPFLGVLQQGTSRVIGDPNLASEKLTQIDLGLRANYDWVQFGAGVFYGWINDYITYDQNSGGPGLTQVVYTNTDLATIAGTELFGQMDVTSWLSTYATMTYVQGIDQTHNVNRRSSNLTSSRATNAANGQYATDTEALPQIPPLESRVGFRIHQPSLSPKWQIDLGARMVASQNNVAKSLGELGTPGFTTFNIRTYWQASERWLLTAGVENLGNRFYREHLDPVSGTILGINPLYRPGTNFYFGSQYSY